MGRGRRRKRDENFFYSFNRKRHGLGKPHGPHGPPRSTYNNNNPTNQTTMEANNQDPNNTADLTDFVQNLLQQMQTRFQQMSDSIIGRIDEMGSRIDDLEKSIGDLIQQAGLDEFDMASKPPTTT